MYGKYGLFGHFEGSGPEWYIETIKHAWDLPFWSGTFDLLCYAYFSKNVRNAPDILERLVI